MSVSNFYDLRHHAGHRIVCVEYGNGENVSIECEDCYEVFLSYDRVEDDDEEVEPVCE